MFYQVTIVFNCWGSFALCETMFYLLWFTIILCQLILWSFALIHALINQVLLFMFYHTTVLVYSPELSKRMFYPLSPQYLCVLRNHFLPFMFYRSTMFLSIQLVFWPYLTFVDPCFTFYILSYHYVLVYLLKISKPMFYPLSPQYLTVEITLHFVKPCFTFYVLP